MDKLKEDILNVFNMNAKFINETKYDIEKYLKTLTVFRIIGENDPELYFEKKIKDENVNFDFIYNFLCQTKFTDFDHEVEVILTEDQEKQNNYNTIFINNEIREYIVTNDELKIKSFLESELKRIKNSEIDKLETLLFTEKHISNFRNEYKARFYFLIGKYRQAKELYSKIPLNDEMVLYCCILLDEIYIGNYLYFSVDPKIYLRRIYFLNEYTRFAQLPFFTYYNMINHFKDSYILTKSILELELIRYLSENNVYEKRIVLSLFKCILFFKEKNFNNLALECIQEIERFTLNKKVYKYLQDIKNQFAIN